MSYQEYPRASMGYAYLERLIDALGKAQSRVTLIYDFNNGELILNDDDLLEKLKLLKIPFKLIPRSKSIHYIKKKVGG